MRTIKFRAFYNNVMHGNEEALRLLYNNSASCDIFHRPDAIIMQFTGLLDKNGVEIYEGDIVNFNGWGKNAEFVSVTTVFWDSDINGWDFNNVSIEDRYDFKKAINYCEIIGNIHQHKNLLES